MSEKKVLIIAYYWPPSGGSGVQRWLKFVKYLPSFGWKPYVFTPENPSFETRDESLLQDIPPEAEVIRFPIWEPYALFSFLSGKNKKHGRTFVPGSGKQSLFQKISTWIRGNLIIPDPRVFWVKPSAKFLDDFMRKNQITSFITTGPPHSIHLIGLRLKKKDPSLKWLADFRDPWSEWGFLDSIRVGEVARNKHRKLEKEVLQTADQVITITPFYVKQFERLSGRKVNLLTNGFDESDFNQFKIIKVDKFILRHVGVVNEKCDPRPFMQAVASLISDHAEIKAKISVEFVGAVHPAFKDFVAANPGLSSITTFVSAVPHRTLIDLYASSAVLVLILTGYKDAEGFMPGKLFEYVATGLPILGVGPKHGDADMLLKETESGEMIESDDMQRIQRYLENQFEAWKNGQAGRVQNKSMQYSRKEITHRLTEIL